MHRHARQTTQATVLTVAAGQNKHIEGGILLSFAFYLCSALNANKALYSSCGVT